MYSQETHCHAAAMVGNSEKAKREFILANSD
jgi:hypothetical protein